LTVTRLDHFYEHNFENKILYKKIKRVITFFGNGKYGGIGIYYVLKYYNLLYCIG